MGSYPAPAVAIRPNSTPDLGTYPIAAQHTYPTSAQAQAQPAVSQYNYGNNGNNSAPAAVSTTAAPAANMQHNAFPGYATSPSTTQHVPTSNSNNNTATNTNTVPSSSNYTRATSGTLPALPSSFPELEKLSTFQLQRLLNDPVALEVGFWSSCCFFYISVAVFCCGWRLVYEIHEVNFSYF